MFRVAVDAMGGDYAPDEVVKGAAEAAALAKHELVLLGRKAVIEGILNNYGLKGNIEVVDAPEVITNNDSPVHAVKKKQQSSMVMGLKMLKSKQVDAFLSAGNTGAFMAGALLMVGRINGVDRPALASVIPTRKGKSLLLDMGANMNSKPVNLLQFAVMGSIYCENVLDIHNPRVGIINVGKEENKGNILVKEAYKTLSEYRHINFIGNIEAREILEGEADVVVCDGFAGNVILKTIEGVAFALFETLKQEINSNLAAKIGGMMLKPALKKIKNRLDYSEYGGAPFLGIDGVCVKCHGASKSRAIKNAVLKASDFLANDVLACIKHTIPNKKERNE